MYVVDKILEVRKLPSATRSASVFVDPKYMDADRFAAEARELRDKKEESKDRDIVEGEICSVVVGDTLQRDVLRLRASLNISSHDTQRPLIVSGI